MAEDIARLLGPLSASSGGQLVKITQTTSPGTLVHTTGANSEKLWFLANNKHTAAVDVTVQWGGTSSDDEFTLSLNPATGLIEVVSGYVLGASKHLRIYASVANVVFVLGESIEISNTI